MKLALDRLGKDGYMYLYGETPLPREYAFMPLDDLHRELPPDAGERVLVAVDCASELRLGTAHEEVLERVVEYLLFVVRNEYKVQNLGPHQCRQHGRSPHHKALRECLDSRHRSCLAVW